MKARVAAVEFVHWRQMFIANALVCRQGFDQWPGARKSGVNCIREPLSRAKRVRNSLRQDRILVIASVADQRPTVPVGLAEEVGKGAGALICSTRFPSRNGSAKSATRPRPSAIYRPRSERMVWNSSRGHATYVIVNPSFVGKLIIVRRGRGRIAGRCGGTSLQ